MVSNVSTACSGPFWSNLAANPAWPTRLAARVCWALRCEISNPPTRSVIYVSWYEAAAYAAWKGCQLPTEAQWERAARGVNARRYPWGNLNPDDRRMNYNVNIG